MDTPVLATKFRPAVHPRVLQRDRLLKGLTKNSSKKLILLVSYPGAGKATLMAQWLASQTCRYVWYNLDKYDQDPSTFFHHLVRAIQEKSPGFLHAMEPSALSAPRLWPAFVQELQEKICDPFFIVFADYECVQGAKPVGQFVNYLLQHQPPLVHLAILSTQTPKFHLTHHRLRGDLFHLKTEDLAFTSGEAFALFTEVFRLGVSRSTADQIARETEGWALALSLCGHSMTVQDPAGEKPSCRFNREYKEDLHAYFLEDILKSQSEEVQDLLLCSALLPFISFDELRNFLGQSEGELLLRAITESGIPIAPVNGGAGIYRYHGLFRDFILNRLQGRKSEQEVTCLYGRAARFLRNQYPVEAVELYMKAGEPAEAVSLLEDLGWALLRKGQYETLKTLLKPIPPRRRAANPVLNYFMGRIREIYGEVEEAQAFYQKALGQLSDDSLSMKAACEERLGIIEIKMDRFSEADRILCQTLDRLEKSEIRRETVKRLIACHSNLAKTYSKLEEGDKSNRHLKRARSLFDLYGEPPDKATLVQAEALEAVVTGRFQEALALGVEGKDLCWQSGFEARVPLFDHYLSFANLYLGHFAEAGALAEEGLAILQRHGVRDNVYGALRSDLGHCALAAGQVEEGIQGLRESTAVFHANQNFCGQFWNDCALCLLAARQGGLSEAWDYWRKMERNSRKLSLPMQHAMTLTAEAYLSSLEEAPDKTMERLSEAKPFLARSRQKMSVLQALVLAIRSYLNIGRDDLAEETFTNVVNPGDLRESYYSLHYDLHWFSSFAERLRKGSFPFDVTLASVPLPSGPVDPAGSPSVTQQGPASGFAARHGLLDLKVCALGPFRILVNGWEIPLAQCPSKKALTLIKYLFLKRHASGVLLDEALELLWPGMDPEATRSNLRVILSMLRKVFRKPGAEVNGFANLAREGNRLVLGLGENGWTDVDEFMGQVKLAAYKEKMTLWSEAMTHYENILSLYQGDFLADEPYAEWCYLEREYLRDQYLGALIRKADCHERSADLSEAISTLYRLLKVDMYREDAYQRLMRLCFSAGRKGELVRAYELCRKSIQDDLGLPLSADTLALCKEFSIGTGKRALRPQLLGMGT